MIDNRTIDDFFSQYASTFNNALFGEVTDSEMIRNSFAAFVVGANPNGVAGGINDDQFAKSIKQGIEFYKQIGITSMNISSREITVLDDFHAMVRVNWTSFYFKEARSGQIAFTVFYLLQSKNDRTHIFAYVTGDEQRALRDHKLI